MENIFKDKQDCNLAKLNPHFGLSWAEMDFNLDFHSIHPSTLSTHPPCLPTGKVPNLPKTVKLTKGKWNRLMSRHYCQAQP